MANNVKKLPKITTPKGIAQFPHLVKPNTTFVPEGVYEVKMLFDRREVGELLDLLDNYAEESFQKALQENPKHAKKIVKVDPYTPLIDDEGVEDENMVVINFKQKAKHTTKDGQVYVFTVKLFDSQGKPVKVQSIWSGSVLRVSATPSFYFVAATKQAGVTLNLNAVQIIELVDGGGDAESYGFGKEDGFVSEEEEGFEGGGEPDIEDEDNF